MVDALSVQTSKDAEALFDGYRALYGRLAKPRFMPGRDEGQGVVFDLKPDFGSGAIQLYRLLGDAVLSVYDLVFEKDLARSFDLSADYFEIEYCLDGCMHIEEDTAGGACFGPGCLSLSLSQDMRGSVSHRAGERYRGVSFSASRRAISAYFGSLGVGAWNDEVERLCRRERAAYYLGRAVSPEIGRPFQQIHDCRLPVGLRILFYESKVMEALALIASSEAEKREGCERVPLSAYELQKIKEIPQMLLDRPFELPSLHALSREVAVSPKKINKGFKLVFGDTPYCYHRKLVLSRAAAMLLETDRPVGDIAYANGYSSPSNFCAAFKKRYGLTPLKYRTSSLLH